MNCDTIAAERASKEGYNVFNSGLGMDVYGEGQHALLILILPSIFCTTVVGQTQVNGGGVVPTNTLYQQRKGRTLRPK